MYIYMQSEIHIDVNWGVFVLSTENPTVLIFLDVKEAPKV